MRHRGLLFCSALVFLLGVIAWAGGSTRLRVVVKTQSGRPVERASVIVKCLDRSAIKLGKLECPPYELKTNQEGEAKLPPIPQGRIRIQVIAKGYQTFGKDFQIDTDEKTVEIKLNPPQQQYSSHQ